MADAAEIQKHTPGPYWLNTVASGAHHVCGRHGKVMFRYPAEQKAIATKQIRDTASDMLAALEFVASDPSFSKLGSVTQDEVRAVIAKARSSQGED